MTEQRLQEMAAAPVVEPPYDPACVDCRRAVGKGLAGASRSALDNECRLSESLTAQRDAALAERDHERLRYDGMRSDRDDWRKRCEVAIARCLYIDRAGRTSDGHR